MSARIEIDRTEIDGIGLVTDGTPEWLIPSAARELARTLLEAADALDK
ncbi:MAG: hypothetical protein GX862_09945 [Leucobacter sp.]|nr:hypothetical protein [Leucobacter sp.]